MNEEIELLGYKGRITRISFKQKLKPWHPEDELAAYIEFDEPQPEGILSMGVAVPVKDYSRKELLEVVRVKKVKWFDIKKRKPVLGETVLVFEQGYSSQGNYWSQYEVATYITNPYDRRRRIFTPWLQAVLPTPWDYDDVTHWMPLPKPPNKLPLPIKLVNQ
jgi:hypothetical protein